MIRNPLKTVRQLLVWTGTILVVGFGPFATRSFADEPDRDMHPYRVLVAVTFDSTQGYRNRLRSELHEDIENRLKRTYGKMWSVTVQDHHLFSETGARGLRNLSAEKVLKWFPENNKEDPSIPQWDKIFFTHIDYAAANVSVVCREWDAHARHLSPMEQEILADNRALPQSAVELIKKSFRPLVEFGNVDNLDVSGIVHGGTISSLDSGAKQLEPNDVIVPFFRYQDKEHKVQRIQFVNWTYLLVDSVEHGFLKSTLVAGIRFPLGTNRRRRVQLMGLKLNRRTDRSRLKLVLHSAESEPMIGSRVEVVAKRQYRDESRTQDGTKRKPQKFISDRRGNVDIPASVLKKFPVVWVYVYSGRALVARVPFAPGMEPERTLTLRDDSIRLQFEGEHDLLLGELIDVIANQTALLAQARSYTKKGNQKKVEEKIAAINALPKLADFEDKLNIIYQKSKKDAEALNNRWAMRRIDELSNKITHILNKFLGPEPTDKLNKRIEAFKTGGSE